MQQVESTERSGRIVAFFADILRGAAIGIAFIIPGFSGGSVAAILGIYERLVGAVADIFKDFKRSFLILLPVALGMLLGVCALIVPIRWGLAKFPIPTVSLFVGLAIGGLPSVKAKVKGKPTVKNGIALVLAALFAASLAFLPTASRPEGFLFRLDAVGYLLLFFVGMAGACALVVPGISGSMLLLIFGYYTPLMELFTEYLLRGRKVGTCLLVVGVTGLGILCGFFLVSLLMRTLLKRYPRATYFAILGFIAGSVAAVYAPILKTPSPLYADPWYWVCAVLLLLAGVALSVLFYFLARKRSEKQTN